MPRRKTHEEVEQEMRDLVGNDYQMLSTYVNAKEKFQIIHHVCGHQYHVNWNNFKIGRRCPQCSGRLTNKEFTSRVMEQVGTEYIFLDKYKTSREKLRVKHNTHECGHTYEVTPNHFLKGRRCPKCWATSRRKSNEEFIQEVYELVGDEYTPKSIYETNRIKLKMYHERCGEMYMVSPGEFLQGVRCPICRESKGEKRVKDFLKSLGVYFIEEVSFEGFVGRNNVPYKYDFCLKDIEGEPYLIEYDGEQHYKSNPYFGGEDGLIGRQINDEIKNKYAEDNNIELLRIPYWDYDNIEKVLNEFIKRERIKKWRT